MQSTAGLRKEIILNITLLMGAALLFSGFLLLKLTERELVLQRTGSVTAAMEITAKALAPVFSEGLPAAGTAARVSSLLGTFPAPLLLDGWRLTGHELAPLASSKAEGLQPPSRAQMSLLRFSAEPSVRLQYPPVWLPFARGEESSVTVTVPLGGRGDFLGALQARFSLADVRERVGWAQRLILLYTVLYGAVLVAFGVYLLNRTVVRPVRRLQEGTRQVAAGILEPALPVEGPAEIAELAGSFNAMTAALRESRGETEAHIASLQAANADLRRTRDELVRSEKMASVGHLAAGMAHEIGNPLGATIGYLGFLRGELPPGREREILERALGETGRIDRLVKDLLDYAAPASSEAERVDPAAVLVEARELLAHQGIFDGVRLAGDLPPTLPAVTVVRHKLLQVFVNLLLNARDASPPGGTIGLAGGAGGGEVWLSVTDEGGGMGEEVLAHIFNPFYTTKAPGRGRGLGLSVCHRVVEEAGGRIEVASRPGEGSVFTVRLRQAEGMNDEP